MALGSNQIPTYATVLNGGVAKPTGSSNTVTLGVDTNGVTAYTAGAYGGMVTSLTGVTDDTVTSNIFVWILNGSTVKPIGLVNIPLSSGNTNAARFNVDFLDGVNILGLPLDPATGKRYIQLLAGETLRVGALANFSSGKSAWITAMGQDFAA